MPTSVSTSQPLANLLYRDDNVIVTNSRIEIKEVSCAAKFVSSIELHEEEPSHTLGWSYIAFCAIASLVLLGYLYFEKIPVGVYIIGYFAIALFAAAVTWKLLIAPAKYRIDFSLINGQRFEITHNSLLQIRAMHAAIQEAVAQNSQEAIQGDRMDTGMPAGLARRSRVEPV